MSETNTEPLPPEHKPAARVGAIQIDMGKALAKRNRDLVDAEPASLTPEQHEQVQRSLLSLLPERAYRALEAVQRGLGITSREFSGTSNKPVELKPPVALDQIERVVRECPELSRAIAAITVGVGSRGFSLVPIDTEKQNEADDATKAEAKIEHEDLTAWFKHICPNRSFSQVMKITVSSRKRFAFAAWEILRNPLRQVNGINPIEDCKTIHWCLQDNQLVTVQKLIRTGDRVQIVSEQRRFRRFMQVIKEGFMASARKAVFFKEFGDPRYLNANTGEYWASSAPPPDNFPFATELLIFPVVDAGGEHPCPEWLPILPDALASRAIRIINLDTLNNGATPPFLVIIEGTVDEGELAKITDQFKDIQGETSRRRAIFVQVDSTTVGAGTAKDAVTPSVRIEPMSQLMTTEGMFLKYLTWLERSISSSLRLPLLLVGNIDSTLNRATAEAALVFAEDQVFSPERQDIEDTINDILLPEVALYSNQISNKKGVKHWRFKLNGYNADKTADYIKLLIAEKGAMSINERRAVIDTMLPDHKLPAIDTPAASEPVALIAPEAPAGLTALPDESPITNTLKADISRHHLGGKPISKIYILEEAA